MFKKCFARKSGWNTFDIDLWTDEGYEKIEDWKNYAYKECDESKATHIGLKGEPLIKTLDWKNETEGMHFHDMPPYQKFLVEKYGTNDETSNAHKILYFDIETEMGDALTPEYIRSAPKKITSIAYYDETGDEWCCLILDPDNKISSKGYRNKKIISCGDEKELLGKFITKWNEIEPDIVVGWNSDYFDIPYLIYRSNKILGKDITKHFSPIEYIRETPWLITERGGQYMQICGVQSLDYMRLHKKFSWADEPSMRLQAIGEKYVKLGKVDYEGNLDRLYETDIDKFIQYNFRDVEILVELDKKLEYISLVKNLSHKGKHNYEEVYANTKTQDGAISAYLLSKGIIPPRKGKKVEKQYAGGYLFCPKAGIYNYMFDLDFTSLYPTIIMTVNIGNETMVGRIDIPYDELKVKYEGKEVWNCRYSLSDLKNMDPDKKLNVISYKNSREGISQPLKVKDLIHHIEKNKWTISANGVMYSSKTESVLSTILKKWFNERVMYKNQMKEAKKAGNKELAAQLHMKQYTMKILLNSLYGATALGVFRYGNILLAESITLTGQRLIQDSAKAINEFFNDVMEDKTKLELC
jgi:DNA polymerase elongation subunit (family B)